MFPTGKSPSSFCTPKFHHCTTVTLNPSNNPPTKKPDHPNLTPQHHSSNPKRNEGTANPSGRINMAPLHVEALVAATWVGCHLQSIRM